MQFNRLGVLRRRAYGAERKCEEVASGDPDDPLTIANLRVWQNIAARAFDRYYQAKGKTA